MTKNSHYSDSSFFPFSRGFAEYQATFTPAAQALYIYLLAKAEWRDCPDYGIVKTTARKLSEGIGVSPNTARRLLKELRAGYPIAKLSRSGKTAPPLIAYKAIGSTKGRVYHVKILKAKLRVSFFNKVNGKKRAAAQRRSQSDGAVFRAGERVSKSIESLVERTASALDMKKGKQ